MNYEAANSAKATFGDVYTAPTPHSYIEMIARLGYEIPDRAQPYCVTAAELVRSRTRGGPVRMLDIGCSYGIGSALIRYGLSVEDMKAFFASHPETPYQESIEATRAWLSEAPHSCDVECIGLDSSGPAVSFAEDVGLLDAGIARDFEVPDAEPTFEERTWFRGCNLLISTGAVGYLTDRTFEAILPHWAKDIHGFGPAAVLTILRMFDPSPIRSIFERHGFKFGVVPGIRLPQRRFADDQERAKVLSLLHDRKIDTRGWEETGKHFADLYIAAPKEDFSDLLDRMSATRA